jgi:TonB family protein
VQITVGVAHSQGSLDRDIVRRIIRQHLNEVKYCYEQQLPRHPDLAGRISVQFTIASGGNVTASLMQSSSLNNVAVESCIVQAVRRWEFPARPSGMTIVSYPFVLVPAGS